LISEKGEVSRGNVLKVREQDYAAELGPAIMPALADARPEELPPHAWMGKGGTPFNDNFDIRQADPANGKPRVWFRQHRPLVAGEPLTPAQRAVTVADYANGIGTVLPWKSWTFVNGDLSVNIARAPVGEWIMLEPEMWVAQDGVGLTVARLADVQGYFGQATQSLVLQYGGMGAEAPALVRR
jgi:hypothetical protein